MSRLLVILSVFAIPYVGFSEGNWFTAGFGDGAVSTGGTWSTRQEDGRDLPIWREDVMIIPEIENPISFLVDDGKSTEGAEIVIRYEFDFQGYDVLPEIDPEAKVGVCLLAEREYWVVGYDVSSGVNKWVDSRIRPSYPGPVSVEIRILKGVATYCIGSGMFEVPCIADSIEEVCFCGSGSVSMLEGEYSLTGVLTVPPVVDGLRSSCLVERAEIGEEVTVEFAADTKIPNRNSAVYIVGEGGTLTLKEGEVPVKALDPGAKIGSAPYLTFDNAYVAAKNRDTIVLCTDQDLEVDIEKNVTIDLAGKVMTVASPVEIKEAELTFEDSAKADKGKLVLESAFSVADGDSMLDISAIIFECDGGYLTGVEGIISVPKNLKSANKMIADGYFGEKPKDLTVIVFVGDLVYNGVGDRFAIAGEVAYATVGESRARYVESFAVVQEAIDAADEVYLCYYYGEEGPDSEEIDFKASTVVYAYHNEDDLVDCTLLPEGKVKFDASLGENGGWKIAGGSSTFYPTYIDPSDDELRAKFDKWASEVAYDRDRGSANIDAFLLKCSPADVETEKGKFVISSITKGADGDWEVKVGEKGQDDEYGNGYINIISVKTNKFPTAGANTDFFQATLTIQPTVVK